MPVGAIPSLFPRPPTHLSSADQRHAEDGSINQRPPLGTGPTARGTAFAVSPLESGMLWRAARQMTCTMRTPEALNGRRRLSGEAGNEWCRGSRTGLGWAGTERPQLEDRRACHSWYVDPVDAPPRGALQWQYGVCISGCAPCMYAEDPETGTYRCMMGSVVYGCNASSPLPPPLLSPLPPPPPPPPPSLSPPLQATPPPPSPSPPPAPQQEQGTIACSDVGCIRAALNRRNLPASAMQTILLSAPRFHLSGTPIQVPDGLRVMLTSSGGSATIDAQGKSRAFTVETNARLTLIDVTILNGLEPDGEGGGISVVGPNSRLVLRGVKIAACSAARGGGIHLRRAHATLNDTTIENCHADAKCANPTAPGMSCAVHDGGGIAVDLRSTAELNRCLVRGCSAADDGGGLTGKNLCSLALRDTSVVDCHAGDDGGAVQLHSSSVLIHDSQLRGCSAANVGGAVYVHAKSSADIVSSNISDCRAVDDGGGLMIWKDSHATIRKTSIRGCRAGANGGAIATRPRHEGRSYLKNEPSPPVCGLRVEDSTFENCSASRGGGLLDLTWAHELDPTNRKLEMHLSNLTFYRCRASVAGSAFAFVRNCTPPGAPPARPRCKGLAPVTGQKPIRLDECCVTKQGRGYVSMIDVQAVSAAAGALARVRVLDAGSCPLLPLPAPPPPSSAAAPTYPCIDSPSGERLLGEAGPERDQWCYQQASSELGNLEACGGFYIEIGDAATVGSDGYVPCSAGCAPCVKKENRLGKMVCRQDGPLPQFIFSLCS